jgi:hypothetical protein
MNTVCVRFFGIRRDDSTPERQRSHFQIGRLPEWSVVLATIISPTVINEVKIGFNGGAHAWPGYWNVVGIDTPEFRSTSKCPNSGIPGRGIHRSRCRRSGTVE